MSDRNDWQQEEDLSILLAEFSRSGMDKSITADLSGQRHCSARNSYMSAIH